MKRIRRSRPPVQKEMQDSVFPFLSTRQHVPQERAPRPPVTRKDFVLVQLDAIRTGILDFALALPREKQDRVFLGEWTPRDLIAHLAGWDIALLAAAQDILVGQLPGFYHLRDEDWKTINSQFVKQYNQGTWAELLKKVEGSHGELLAFLDTLPQEEFTENHGVTYDGSPVTIGRLMAGEIKDEKEHYDQLAVWLGIPKEDAAAKGILPKGDT